MARCPATVRVACIVAAGWSLGWPVWLALAVVAAACVASFAGAAGPDPPSTTRGQGSSVFQVDTHATIEYSSADALFPDLSGAVATRPRWASSATTRRAATQSFQFDGGSIEYVNVDSFLANNNGSAPHAGDFDATAVRLNGGGWPSAGPGRAEGSGLKLRKSLDDVLVVLFATMAYSNLEERFDGTQEVLRSMTALRVLRRKYKNVTYAALRGRAWNLARSGTVGVVLKFGSAGARNAQGQHEILVVTASLEGGDVACSCSEDERCLGASGCSMRPSILTALQIVRAAMEVDLVDLFSVLGASVKAGRLRAGTGVLYGDKVCVVRNGKTSWPFTAVRRTRGGSWICLSCRTGDGTCDHAAAAVAAAKAEAEGLGDDSSDSDVEEDEGDEKRLLELAGLRADADQEASGAVELPPHFPAPTEALPAVNRFKWQSRSDASRHLVPPLAAQRERANLMRALRDPRREVRYTAGPQCPLCLVGRHPQTAIETKHGKVEFEDGVVPASVETWRCHLCLFRVLPDGKARGVVFHSCYTIYSEAFLFEAAVNLARNGTSLHATAYLRQAYTELSGSSKYPHATKRMRSVTTLRKALLLYLALVIKGLPYDTVSCATCRRADGSYVIVSFDGLQLGYRLKYKIKFNRTAIKIHAVSRASLVPRFITDEATSKAIGRVLSTKKKGMTDAPTKAITTVTAMRGHVMALTLLLGNVVVEGKEKTFSGDKPHMQGGTATRGWDPMVDGGASVELVDFLRGVFDVRAMARSLALTIVAASDDLRRRVPVDLMARATALVTELPAPPSIVCMATTAQDGAVPTEDKPGMGETDADRLRVKRARHGSGKDDASSLSSSGASSSDQDVFSSDEDGYCMAPRIKEPREAVWDRAAPLLNYGEALEEPALGTTGGTIGAQRLENLSMPLLPHIPGTAASMVKILEFVRAIVVDPVLVWAPQGSWAAVDAVLNVLNSDRFAIDSLAATLSLPVVKEQRLLRGAVACLGPGLDANPALRQLLAAVLLGMKRRVVEYDTYVAEVVALDSRATEALREEMAAAHPMQTFSHVQFTGAWLLPPATVAAYRSVYGEYTDQDDDYLKTGIWAPGLPVLRPMPGFAGEATTDTDLPDCKHEMGKETSHTGGTIGVFCTCAHPKCLGVIVLSGSESQRMPLEFVVQRFVQMPRTIIYDFACATLKTALVRLPFLARLVPMKCDRFHWRTNHTDCSCAMSPDSYEALDGVNTSSCEERNALSRKQQHHVRQMKQDQFITFTIYQQAVSNVVAMHREGKTLGASSKWPEWYRRTHVDVPSAPKER